VEDIAFVAITLLAFGLLAVLTGLIERRSCR